MKVVSLLFLFDEKKRIKSVLVVAVIMFKNGVFKMVNSVFDVRIVGTVL